MTNIEYCNSDRVFNSTMEESTCSRTDNNVGDRSPRFSSSSSAFIEKSSVSRKRTSPRSVLDVTVFLASFESSGSSKSSAEPTPPQHRQAKSFDHGKSSGSCSSDEAAKKRSCYQQQPPQEDETLDGQLSLVKSKSRCGMVEDETSVTTASTASYMIDNRTTAGTATSMVAVFESSSNDDIMRETLSSSRVGSVNTAKSFEASTTQAPSRTGTVADRTPPSVGCASFDNSLPAATAVQGQSRHNLGPSTASVSQSDAGRRKQEAEEEEDPLLLLLRGRQRGPGKWAPARSKSFRVSRSGDLTALALCEHCHNNRRSLSGFKSRSLRDLNRSRDADSLSSSRAPARSKSFRVLRTGDLTAIALCEHCRSQNNARRAVSPVPGGATSLEDLRGSRDITAKLCEQQAPQDNEESPRWTQNTSPRNLQCVGNDIDPLADELQSEPRVCRNRRTSTSPANSPSAKRRSTSLRSLRSGHDGRNTSSPARRRSLMQSGKSKSLRSLRSSGDDNNSKVLSIAPRSKNFDSELNSLGCGGGSQMSNTSPANKYRNLLQYSKSRSLRSLQSRQDDDNDNDNMPIKVAPLSSEKIAREPSSSRSRAGGSPVTSSPAKYGDLLQYAKSKSTRSLQSEDVGSMLSLVSRSKKPQSDSTSVCRASPASSPSKYRNLLLQYGRSKSLRTLQSGDDDGGIVALTPHSNEPQSEPATSCCRTGSTSIPAMHRSLSQSGKSKSLESLPCSDKNVPLSKQLESESSTTCCRTSPTSIPSKHRSLLQSGKSKSLRSVLSGDDNSVLSLPPLGMKLPNGGRTSLTSSPFKYRSLKQNGKSKSLRSLQSLDRGTVHSFVPLRDNDIAEKSTCCQSGSLPISPTKRRLLHSERSSSLRSLGSPRKTRGECVGPTTPRCSPLRRKDSRVRQSGDIPASVAIVEQIEEECAPALETFSSAENRSLGAKRKGSIASATVGDAGSDSPRRRPRRRSPKAVGGSIHSDRNREGEDISLPSPRRKGLKKSESLRSLQSRDLISRLQKTRSLRKMGSMDSGDECSKGTEGIERDDVPVRLQQRKDFSHEFKCSEAKVERTEDRLDAYLKKWRTEKDKAETNECHRSLPGKLMNTMMLRKQTSEGMLSALLKDQGNDSEEDLTDASCWNNRGEDAVGCGSHSKVSLLKKAASFRGLPPPRANLYEILQDPIQDSDEESASAYTTISWLLKSAGFQKGQAGGVLDNFFKEQRVGEDCVEKDSDVRSGGVSAFNHVGLGVERSKDEGARAVRRPKKSSSFRTRKPNGVAKEQDDAGDHNGTVHSFQTGRALGNEDCGKTPLRSQSRLMKKSASVRSMNSATRVGGSSEAEGFDSSPYTGQRHRGRQSNFRNLKKSLSYQNIVSSDDGSASFTGDICTSPRKLDSGWTDSRNSILITSGFIRSAQLKAKKLKKSLSCQEANESVVSTDDGISHDDLDNSAELQATKSRGRSRERNSKVTSGGGNTAVETPIPGSTRSKPPISPRRKVAKRSPDRSVALSPESNKQPTEEETNKLEEETPRTGWRRLRKLSPF